MASLGSSIRSAARATFSAYRSVPIRWRLAGGSAALTFVILAGFAAIVGVLTDRQVTHQFIDQMQSASSQLAVQIKPRAIGGAVRCDQKVLSDYSEATKAEIRVFDVVGDVLCTQEDGLTPGQMGRLRPQFALPTERGSYDEHGYRVQAQEISWSPLGDGWLIYARPLSSIQQTINKVRVFLVLGVFGGTILALLAGLATAQRAMRPIAQLTDAAREIERTRDPSRHIPHPEADDEIAELARTLEGMLGGLDASRGETEAALSRQREFVADASHELRTPLTSVLANLELLADELHGEQAESARAALRSTQRMRRLVGDLLLLARADVERRQPRRSTDLGQVLTEAAGELGSMAEEHDLTIEAGSATVEATRDDLHRLVLNLLENAVHHTPPGTTIRARTGVVDGVPTLVVEDDGPGIAPEMRRRVFERFVRGGGDAGAGARGTGLGLAIVQAVAEAHGAQVTLGDGLDRVGTRFEIRFTSPEASHPPVPHSRAAGDPVRGQTSTTTGSTIGRRRSRS